MYISDFTVVMLEIGVIRIYINGQLAWDDFVNDNDEFVKLIRRQDPIAAISFKTVEFHHAEVYITLL